jgi:dTDP-4-dehydrorhamnose 3,5-epimerase-like enzyme
MEENRIFNGVQLQEKNIEPSRDNQGFLSRNFQLGNIQEKTFIKLGYQTQRAIEFQNFPYSYGGFLTERYAQEKLHTSEALLVVSGSIKGFVRESNNTAQQIQKLEQTNKGALSSMFGKK